MSCNGSVAFPIILRAHRSTNDRRAGGVVRATSRKGTLRALSVIRPVIGPDHGEMPRDDLEGHFSCKVTAAMFNDVRKATRPCRLQAWPECLYGFTRQFTRGIWLTTFTPMRNHRPCL
jgi:hypothetical protein